MTVNLTGNDAHPISSFVSFDDWLESLGKTRATGWRWRKTHPWLETTNIFGRLYISREVIGEFERRAVAGEFAQAKQPGAAR